MPELRQTGSLPRPRTSQLCWKVLSLLTRHPGSLAILLGLIVVAASLDLAVPFLTQHIIDRILRSLKSPNAGSVEVLLMAAVGIFAATALNRILRSLYNYRLFRAVAHSEDEIKNAAFANFLHLDTEYHSGVNTGEVIGALDRGGTAIMVVLFEIFGQNLVPPLLIVAGGLTALLLKSPWIAAIVFMPLPAYVLAVSRFSEQMQDLEHGVSQAFETVSKESYDIASNSRIVKKFAQENQEARMQMNLLGVARDKQFRGERMWALIENVQTAISTAGRVGVIALGGYLVLTHRCTVGDYVLFIALQDMVYGPISQLSIILPKLRRNLSRAERLFEILNQSRKVCDPPAAPQLPVKEHSIEFQNLSFRYSSNERWTLKDVNFKVPEGSTVALIGASGSGKSTLMNLMQRLYDPQAGRITIDGQDIREVTQHSLREQIAVVPQEVDLFSRSILENIGYGLEKVSRAEVEKAACMAQAHEFILRSENGYDTQVGERGLKLSGGERQRIGIARAIVRDPRILILDEATSHLDNESERLIQVAMEKVTKGRTCFIIAHRLTTVRKADMVVVFAGGGIEAVGTHEELWNSSETYRNLHGLHVAERKPKPRPTFAESDEDLALAVGE
jgi:ABC-type multidrug transport system fused ATPase/permease subunit